MDHDQRMTAAQQQDPQMAARVVRNIEQIEDDSHLAYGGPVSQRLMNEVSASARPAAPDNWIFEGSDDSLRLMAPEWKANRGVNQKDAWFELADLVEDEHRDHSWVSVLVSKGNTQLILELKFRPGLTPVVQALHDKDPVIVHLIKAGFKRDPETKRIYMPINLDAGAVAKGLEENDLDQAFLAVREVTGLAVGARPAIDTMLEHIRAEAKKK